MGVSTFKKVLQLMTPAERRSAAVLLVLMLVGMMLETLGIGLVVPVVAFLTQPDYAARSPAIGPALNELLGHPSHTMLVMYAMMSLVCAYLLKNLFLAFMTWRQMRFAFDMQAQLSQRLFALYLRQPYTFHLQRNSAQLLRNVTGEVTLLTNSAVVPGLLLLSEGFVLAGLCTVLFIVEPLGAFIVVTVLGLVAGAFYRISRPRLARWALARQHHEGFRIQHLQQGLHGAKDVKVLGREDEFLTQYREHNIQSARAGQLYSTLAQMPRLLLEVLAITGFAVLVATMLAQGRPLEAVLPTLGLFAAAAFRLMPSVNRALTSIQSMRYGMPVINTLHAELQLEPQAMRSGEATQRPFNRQIELRNVSFVYATAREPALDQLSLAIQRGESIGFIGTSGAGKSTLVDILLGLLTPTHGEVCVDGRNVQSCLRGWQDQIGYVPQSIFLTDDSIRRNVAFGLPNPQIDDASVWRALQAAQLDEFVRALPQGLDTLVGERGVRLSGGQRQRIGIARALYHDPDVLVLDEATSSLDAATEREVMRAVEQLHGSKTLLIVAHRLSTVEQCDRLYSLQRGKIVDSGPPHVLLQARILAQSN